MSEKTNIAWTDSTLNFWEGCTKVSDGCKNCYAEARDKRFTGGKLWGKGAPRRKSKSAVKDALAFNRNPWVCDECGGAFASNLLAHLPDGKPDSPTCCQNNGGYHRRRIFSLSLGDWLDDEVPIEWLAEMLDTIRQCPDVTWILCTKRPENWRGRMGEVAEWHEDDGAKTYVFGEIFDAWLNAWIEDEPPANIILLTSVENQPMADKRIPELLKIPAACRGLSLEPLLGAVDLNRELGAYESGNHSPLRSSWIQQLDWLIIGGESGANARPCNVDWIRSIVEQGKAAGVAVFVKQFGSNPFCDNANMFNWPDDLELQEAGTAFAACKPQFTDKKGGDPSQWPDGFAIQEWPEGF
jgi:protein gp37